jgi:predicted nucleotidyltransferase
MLATNKLLPIKKVISLSSNIIKEKLPNAKVFLYGSRARGGARLYSDIDIAILNTKKTTSVQLFEIEEK